MLLFEIGNAEIAEFIKSDSKLTQCLARSIPELKG